MRTIARRHFETAAVAKTADFLGELLLLLDDSADSIEVLPSRRSVEEFGEENAQREN